MNSKSVTALKNLQKQLSYDYMDFFVSLRESYPTSDVSSTSIYRRADATIGRIQRALRLFGRMLGAGETQATLNEMKELMSEIDAINKEKDELVKIARRDNQLAEALSKTEQVTGVSETDLQVSSSALRQAVQQRLKETNEQSVYRSGSSRSQEQGTFDKYSKLLGGFYLASGVLQPLLGPYARPVAAIAKGIPVVGRGMGRLFDKMNAPVLSPEREDVGLNAELEMERASFRGGREGTGGRETSFYRSPSTATESFSASLFEFFDKKAFNARWTKSILDTLKNVFEKDESKSGIWNVLKMLGLTALGAALTAVVIEHWDTVKKYGQKFWDYWVVNGKEHWEEMKKRTSEFWESLKTSIKTIWDPLKEGAKLFWSFLDTLGFKTLGEKITASSIGLGVLALAITGPGGTVAAILALTAACYHFAKKDWELIKDIGGLTSQKAEAEAVADKQKATRIKQLESKITDPNSSEDEKKTARLRLADIINRDRFKLFQISPEKALTMPIEKLFFEASLSMGQSPALGSKENTRPTNVRNQEVPDEFKNLGKSLQVPFETPSPTSPVPSAPFLEEEPPTSPSQDLSDIKLSFVDIVDSLKKIATNATAPFVLGASGSMGSSGITDPLYQLNRTRRQA